MLALVDIVPGVPTSLISCHLLKYLTNQTPLFALLSNQTPLFAFSLPVVGPHYVLHLSVEVAVGETDHKSLEL